MILKKIYICGIHLKFLLIKIEEGMNIEYGNHTLLKKTMTSMQMVIFYYI